MQRWGGSQQQPLLRIISPGTSHSSTFFGMLWPKRELLHLSMASVKSKSIPSLPGPRRQDPGEELSSIPPTHIHTGCWVFFFFCYTHLVTSESAYQKAEETKAILLPPLCELVYSDGDPWPTFSQIVPVSNTVLQCPQRHSYLGRGPPSWVQKTQN